MLKYFVSFSIIILAMCLGCSKDEGSSLISQDGPYIGIVQNKSSYTLKAIDPTDDEYYIELEPDHYAKWGLKDTAYTFSFRYASDDKYYGSASFRINSVEQDAQAAGIICDWAVIVGEPGWFGVEIDYYP